MSAAQEAIRGALAAAERGLKVIPLSTQLDKNGNWNKRPSICEWPRRATTDAKTIRAWARGDYGDAVMAHENRKPCGQFGATLEGMIAFDADSPEAEEALKRIFREAGEPEIPITLTTRSGRGGAHYIFRQPEGFSIGNSASRLAPNLDTRGGAGGQIVLPGTRNPATGGMYTTGVNAEIATLPRRVAEAVAAVVTSRARTAEDKHPVDRRKGSVPDTRAKIDRAADLLTREEGGVEGQGGEADAFRVAAALGDLGLSLEKAKELMLAVYNPKCCPPWDEDDLAKKVANAYAYRTQEIGCDDPDLAVAAFGEAESYSPSLEQALKRFPVKPMNELFGGEPPVRETLVKDFIAHGKYLTLIYGRGGSGKSLLGMQMMRQLVRNVPFLGMEPGEICGHLVPLILSLEEPAEDTHFRFSRQSSRIDPEGRGGGKEPLFCILRGENPRLFRIDRNGLPEIDAGFKDLVALVKEKHVNLVMIDSLSRVFDGNENDRAAVTAFGRYIDRFTEETGCHVILLAHTNKAGAFSGSSAWEAVCRQMFIVKSELLDGDPVYTLIAEKTNEGPRGRFVRYRFDDWMFVPVSEKEYAERKKGVTETVDVQYVSDIILEMLDEKGEMQQASIEKAMKTAGYKQDVVRETLETMIEDGRVVKEAKRSPLSRRSVFMFRLADTSS